MTLVPLRVYSHDTSHFGQPRFTSNLMGQAQGQSTKNKPDPTFDQKVIRFIHGVMAQATDPTAVIPMLLASPIYHAGRLALLRTVIAKPGASWLGRILKLNILPSLGAYIGETAAFSLSARTLRHHLHDAQPWDLGSVTNDMFMTGITLGILKGATYVGRKSMFWAKDMDEFNSAVWTKGENRAVFASSQISAYLGLVASHWTHNKIFEETDLPGKNIWLDALGAQVALGMGAYGGRFALGERFQAIEHRWAFIARRLLKEVKPTFNNLAYSALAREGAVYQGRSGDSIKNSHLVFTQGGQNEGGGKNTNTNKSDLPAKKWAKSRLQNFLVASYSAVINGLGIVTPAIATRMFTSTIFPIRRNSQWKEDPLLKTAKVFQVKNEDGRIQFYSWGNGPTVLLVHGWNGWGVQLSQLVRPLIERGYKVLTFDAFGHGGSDGKHSNLFKITDGVLLANKIAGPLYGIITHSMGGTAATLALKEGMHVERLVFLSPSFYHSKRLEYLIQMMKIHPKVADRLRKNLEETFGERWKLLNNPRLNQGLDTPLLVVHDIEDSQVSFEEGRTLASVWKGARLQPTRGLGHSRLLKDPDVIRFSVDFIHPPKITSLFK